MASPRLPVSWISLGLGVLTIGIYGVVVLQAVVIYEQRQRPMPPKGPLAAVATQDLLPGHLLTTEDVAAHRLAGYTRIAIPKGAAIVPANLTPAPNLGNAGLLLSIQSLPLAVLQEERIDVGSPVVLCKGKQSSLSGIVQTVQCDAQACRAAVRIDPTKAAAVVGVTSIHRTTRKCG